MKTIGLAIAAAALTLTACGGSENGTSGSNSSLPEPPASGGTGVNAGAGGNSSMNAPGNQLRHGNTIVGSVPSEASDGDSVSDNPGQPGNLQ